MRRFAPIVAALLAAASPCPGVSQVNGGYGDYTAWEEWARVRPGVRAGLASSYDRDGFNEDYNQYEDPPGHLTGDQVVTARTIPGPGILFRFWMPHVTANQAFLVRMYFDGETTPRIDSDSQSILGGTFSYLSDPLVTTFAGGQVCYEPIPFQGDLRIETENRAGQRHYYQYTYLTYPPGTPVGTYSGALSPELLAARQATAAMFAGAGQHPAGASASAIRVPTGATSVPPAGCLVLADLLGPGLIRELRVCLDSAGDEALDSLHLRVRYDGDPSPAVDVPVGDFFGAGHERAAYRSLPMGTDSPDGFYCYWPMPFHDAIRVELCNTSAIPVGIDAAAVEYEPGPVDADMAYLHAETRTTVRVVGLLHHPMLSAIGAGHYVGSLLYVEQPRDDFWMLEGDDIVVIDGADTLHGTGLEDAYNGGYYYNWVGDPGPEPDGPQPSAAIRPLHGILRVQLDAQVPVTRADQYRWQIADRVPFAESIDVKIESKHSILGSQWTSVAFWYQLPPQATEAPGSEEAHLRHPGIELAQSTPNPCRGPVVIGYSLPRRGDVLLEVFDISGARVATLVRGVREAGHHRVRWDPGSRPGGVYCYRLRAGGGERSRKMLYLR